MKANGAEDLEALVAELIKDKPSATLVQQLSSKLGLPYSGDLVTQMSMVLEEVHRVYGSTLSRMNKNSEMEN